MDIVDLTQAYKAFKTSGAIPREFLELVPRFNQITRLDSSLTTLSSFQTTNYRPSPLGLGQAPQGTGVAKNLTPIHQNSSSAPEETRKSRCPVTRTTFPPENLLQLTPRGQDLPASTDTRFQNCSTTNNNPPSSDASKFRLQAKRVNNKSFF